MKRMVKINKVSDNKLSEMFNNFMGIKEAQGIGDKTNYDYQMQLRKFIDASHNTTAYNVLEADTIAFFRAIPDTLALLGLTSPISTLTRSWAGSKKRESSRRIR